MRNFTHKTTYLFRLDDIHPEMDWDKFERLKQIFDRYGVKPLITVIPENKDTSINRMSARGDFWESMKSLRSAGWSIAMHGYQHLYHTKNAGLVNINKYSEFAGLSYEVQVEKIRKGKMILREQGLPTDIFVAPAHSFDENTCRALVTEGFTTMSDGIALWPFEKNGLLSIPQIAWKPRKFFCGVVTFCIHPNTYSESDFAVLEDFLKEHASHVSNFDSVIMEYKTESTKNTLDSFFKKAVAPVFKFIFYLRLRLFKMNTYVSKQEAISKTHYTDPQSYDNRVAADPIEVYLDRQWRTYLRNQVRSRTAGKTIADLGCGTGTYIVDIPVTARVYAVDESPAMLDAAKRKLQGREAVSSCLRIRSLHRSKIIRLIQCYYSGCLIMSMQSNRLAK